jgi:hypothetical protein
VRVRHVSDIDGALRTSEGLEANRKQAPATAELEDFTRWLEISMSSPRSRATVPNQIALNGPDGIAEMIEAVREALLACLVGLEDCNSRTRRHWHQTEMTRRGAGLGELDPERTALQRETASWGQKIRWLQELRLRLEQERAGLVGALPGDRKTATGQLIGEPGRY